jgi:hypothetical protein
MIWAAVAPGRCQSTLARCAVRRSTVRTVADNTDLLVCHVVAPVPPCAVNDLVLEVLQAFDVWVTRLVKLSDCRNQEIALDRVTRAKLGVFASRDLDVHFPARLAVIPCSSLN